MMDIKINIVGDVSEVDLFNMRLTAMKTALACHEYLANWYKWLWRVGIFVVLGLQAAAAFLALFGADSNARILQIVTFASLTITAIVKKLGLGESQKAYSRSYATALDLIGQMEFIRAKHRIPENFNQINEKIASFRLTEEPVPIWVKEKFMT